MDSSSGYELLHIVNILDGCLRRIVRPNGQLSSRIPTSLSYLAYYSLLLNVDQSH